MRTALAVLLVLLIAPLGGVVSGSPGVPVDLEIEGNEIMPTYSRSVQLGFDRVEDLSQYTEEQLSETNEWLVVTRVPIHKHSWTKAAPEFTEPAPILHGAYIWHFEEPLKALPQLQICLLYTSPSPRDRSLSRMPSSA